MIPKIIHYSWFSGEEMPELNKQIMETWKKWLPDYELRLWDAKALAEANIPFANEAVSVGKWAFAADAIRVYAVYHYGGIWLDGDAAVYKSFDEFLNCRMFIGKEYIVENDGINMNIDRWGSHCFGAEPHHPYLKDCLDYYQNRHFFQSNCPNLPNTLRYDMRPIPCIQAVLGVKYGYRGRYDLRDIVEVLDEDIHVYPAYYFDSPRYHDMDFCYCIHYTFGSWREKSMRTPDGTLLQKKYKRNLTYYIYSLVNRLLVKRGLWLQVRSI